MWYRGDDGLRFFLTLNVNSIVHSKSRLIVVIRHSRVYDYSSGRQCRIELK